MPKGPGKVGDLVLFGILDLKIFLRSPLRLFFGLNLGLTMSVTTEQS